MFQYKIKYLLILFIFFVFAPPVFGEEENITAKANQVIKKTEETIMNIVNITPDLVKNGLSSSVNYIENFRNTQEDQFRVRKENKEKEIETQNFEEKGKESAIKKYTTYAELAIFTAAQYLFKWQITFYGFILYVLYSLFKRRSHTYKRSGY